MPDPETVAMHVLSRYEKDYGYDGTPPVPVDDIAASLALLHIEEEDDLRTVPGAPLGLGRLSGLLLTETMTIYVARQEAERSPGRRRFTIAHELGHWYLHAEGSTDFTRYCRDADLLAERHMEGEANAFAAALLTPEPILREQAEATGLNLPLLARRFDVSLPALHLRLLKLDVLPAWMR